MGALVEARVQHRLRPAAEHVEVVGPVHLVDELRPRRARGDLAEHGLATRRAKPLHVGEPGLHAQRVEHPAPERDPVGELGLGVRIPEHDLRRTDPLLRARLERLGEVLRHAVEHRAPRDAHRVVGELLAADELLHDELRHVPELADHALELGAIRDEVGVGGARTRDRLDDHGTPDLLRGRAQLVRRARPRADGHAHAGPGQPLLHQLLVAEAQHRVAGHAAEREVVAQPGRQEHDRLPQRLDPVGGERAQHRPQLAPRARLVEERRRGPDVAGQVAPDLAPQLARRDIGDPDHLRATLRERADELRHLRGVVGGQKDNAHGSLGYGLTKIHEVRIGTCPPAQLPRPSTKPAGGDHCLVLSRLIATYTSSVPSLTL